VTVVGGGVIGLSVAYELARRGFAVRILERGRVGGDTSWAATGILPPANLASATDPLDRLRGLSHQRVQQLAIELEHETGVDTGLRQCGGWYLADSPGERAAMIGMQGYWESLGIQCEQVPMHVLVNREPALADWARAAPTAAAWWVRDEWQIRPPRLLRALATACRNRGVEWHENSAVDDIRAAGDSVTIVAGNRDFKSAAVVICGGAWTGLIAGQGNLQRSIVPIRAQIVVFKTDRPLLGSIANCGHRYIVCREDGYTLVGSCEEEVGFEFGTTEAALQELRQYAFRMLPGLRQAGEVAAWSGLRPMTFEGLPMIGRLPMTNNVLIAAGHYRSGIHLSAGTAVCIAELLSGENPTVDLEPFQVAGQHHELAP